MAIRRAYTETVWNVVDELSGIDAGDATAKAVARGLADTTKYAVDCIKRAGKPLAVLEDWHLP